MGVDVPLPGVVAILKEHVTWQRLHTCRGTPEYRKYRLKYKFILQSIHIILYKSSLKTKANQRHEMEKERMDILQASGVSTSSYKGDSLLDDESSDEDYDGSYNENDDAFFSEVVATAVSNADTAENDDSTVFDADECNSDPNNYLPLLFMFDCETTGLSIYQDHIVELAAQVVVPEGASLGTTEFTTLCYIAQRIPKVIVCMYQHNVRSLSHDSFRHMWHLY